MPCKDCFNGCLETVSDKCVSSTIPEHEGSLFDVLTGVLEDLKKSLEGKNIKIDLEDFPEILHPTEKRDVESLINVIFSYLEKFKKDINDLQPVPVSFDVGCLQNLPPSPSPVDILKALLIAFCSVKTQVDELPSNYVKLSDLTNLVLSIVNTVNNGSVQYHTRAIPGVPYLYLGDLGVFDNTGKGIASLGFDKIYICNGLNGTIDLRGRTGVGAVRNIPGGTLDPAVDPLNPVNSVSSVNYAVGDKFGENFHKQTAQEVGQHTHTITDPGHSHTTQSFYFRKNNFGNENSSEVLISKSGPNSSLKTPVGNSPHSSHTGISIDSNTGGTPFNVRQPSFAGVWIMYIP